MINPDDRSLREPGSALLLAGVVVAFLSMLFSVSPNRSAIASAEPSSADTAAQPPQNDPTTAPTTKPAAGNDAKKGDAPAVSSDSANTTIGWGHRASGKYGAGDQPGPTTRFGDAGGIGPNGAVYSHGGNARRITFVCNASGSMFQKMASVKNELGKAVQGLRPIQSFGIVFMQDEKCAPLNDELLNATPENKRKAQKFLEDVTTTRITDPLPALELAFKQKPQLIYLLTDGDFPDNNAVLTKIRELNKDKKVKINTIAFVISSETGTTFIDLLETIAKENGGVYKHVAEDEL